MRRPRLPHHAGITLAPALMIFAFLGVLLGLIRSSSAGFAVNPAAPPLDLPIVHPSHTDDQRTTGAQADPRMRALSTAGGFAVASDYGDIDPGSSITITDLYRDHKDRTIHLGRHWRPFGIALARGESTAMVAIESNRNIIEVDLLTGDVIGSWEHGLSGPCLITVDPQGSFVIVAARDSGHVTRIDLTTQNACPACGPVRDLGAGIESLSISPDGRTARAILHGGSRAIEIETDAAMRCTRSARLITHAGDHAASAAGIAAAPPAPTPATTPATGPHNI